MQRGNAGGRIPVTNQELCDIYCIHFIHRIQGCQRVAEFSRLLTAQGLCNQILREGGLYRNDRGENYGIPEKWGF